jgi:hypothetical protein
MDQDQPLGDQFPFIQGKAMGIKSDEFRLLEYKLWVALVRLAERTNDTICDDGADFAFDIDDEIKRLERSMGEDG